MRLIDADDLIEIAHEMIQEDPEAFNGGYSYNAVTVEEIAESPIAYDVGIVINQLEQLFDVWGMDEGKKTMMRDVVRNGGIQKEGK